MPRAAAVSTARTARTVSASSTKVPGQRRGRAARVQPAIPLGSLTQPGARAGAHCTACGSDCVTSLQMTLTDGTPVAFTSCHRCEHRTWNEIGGSSLPVAKVLKKARKPR